MKSDIKYNILDFLIKRAPNYVNGNVLRRNLPDHDTEEFTSAIENLISSKKVLRMLDERKEIGKPIYYYKIAKTDNLAIQESIKVADLEVPRILNCSKPPVFPGDFDEVIRQIAKYTNNLETRFTEQVKKERDAYWAKTISIFTIYLGILAIIFQLMQKTPLVISEETLRMKWHIFLLQNFIELLPIIAVFIIVALVLRWIVKK
jgi:hypothetical protein